jgi:hypothetical protein
MWVIVAKKGKNVHRDDFISELLNIEKENFEEFYITKTSTSYRYNISTNIFHAKMYKQKGYCERLIKKQKFYIDNQDRYRNPFHWIKEYHLSYRKVTLEEWNKVCDYELKSLEQSYQHQKSKIEKKRKEFG